MNWIKSTIQAAMVVMVALGLSLGLAEIGLRVLDIGYGNSPIDANDQVHHLHPKSYRYLVYDPNHEYGGHSVVFNEDGYRTSELTTEAPGGKTGKRIAFLGDSFTEALQVAWSDSFVGRIQNSNPDVVVYNFGVSSFSPLIYLVQTKNVVENFKPTDIVLQIYANDLSDDLEYLKHANSQKIEDIDSIDGGKSSLMMRLMRNSYLARLVKKVYAELSLRYRNETGQNLADSFYAPEVPQNSITLEALKEIHNLSDKMGAKLHVFIIPNKSLAMKSQCCRGDSFAKTMMEQLKTAHVPVIDVSPSFEETSDQSNLFFNRDIHLTAKGHVIVADKLSKALDLKSGN